MAKRQTASAYVKSLKKRVPGLARRLTTSLRKGACHEAFHIYGELALVAKAHNKFAWNTRPTIVSEASLRRLRNALRTKCALHREPYER